MNNIRRQIYLGALLHDIGKFYQRASNLSIRKINADYDKEEFGYQHADWTFEFFKLTEVRKVLEKIPELSNNLYNKQDENQFNVANLASNHHRPQNIKEAFVTLGDWWSAGIDRQDTKNSEEKQYGEKKIEWGKARYKTIPLYSVFNIINQAKLNMAFKLKPLSLDKNNVFPHAIKDKADGVNENLYKVQWNAFIDEFQLLPTDSIDGFTESLIYLLKKYTWCIPSNTMDMANVNLFEHLKTTAAFTDSIAEYYNSNPTDFIWNNSYKKLSINENVYPVILYGADISGIQKFIYNIANNKAAKSLKGRSFYLQLLIDSIIQRIISHENIQATIGHVIYSSGGKFYMILPNTSKVILALKELEKEFESEIWKDHKGKLNINTGYSAFAYRNKRVSDKWKNWIEIDGIDGKLGLSNLWKSVSDKMTHRKNQPFKSLLINKWEEFFDETNAALKTSVDGITCSVTGEDLNKSTAQILDKDSDGNPIHITQQVLAQVNLGSALKDSDYRIIHKNAEKHKFLEKRAKRNNSMSVIGSYNYLFNKEELTLDDAEFRGISSTDVSKVLSINNTAFLSAPLKGKNPSYGFQFYGGNKQAEYNTERDKTFDELAKNIKGNDTYLGVLRMDVDNLGDIFIKGFSEEEQSFSAYATLSFLLDLFFSGYLNTIRNNEKYKDFVNILYSGGDDVFAVGRWDKLIEFAAEVRLDFHKFVGREDISISAGLAIVRNKFPISKAADMAGEAESQSKKYSQGSKKKNAITFFGETVSWENDYDDLKKMKDKLVCLITDNNMSHSILHKLMQFGEISKQNQQHLCNGEKNKIDLSYKWHTAYYLKRFLDTYKFDPSRMNDKDKKNKEIFDFIKELQRDLLETKLKYDFVSLACRWAELELREIKNDNNE